MDDVLQIINFNENKKIKFLKIIKGQRSINLTKKILFENKQEADKWFEKLDKKNNKYILIIYERKKITKKYMGIKFIIYNKQNKKIDITSVVGQEYLPELFPLDKI
jgi:hypothetical protein